MSEKLCAACEKVGVCVLLRMSAGELVIKLCRCLPCVFVPAQPRSAWRALRSPVRMACLWVSACVRMLVLSGVLCLELCGGTK